MEKNKIGDIDKKKKSVLKDLIFACLTISIYKFSSFFLNNLPYSAH